MLSPKQFVNTDQLRQPALYFLENGHYCDAPEGTKAYYDYWDEQKERCLNGYSVGGLHITGYHYWYLNFTPILAVTDRSGKSAVKEETFPHFWDGDYNFFWALEIAKDGITEEKVEELDLGFTPLDLEGGHHLVVLKARGKGYSYKAGSMLARNFCLRRKSKNYALAYEKEYLKKDGLLNKAWDNLDHIDANTAYRQPRLKNTEMYKRSGYVQDRGGTDVELGTKNEIMGVSLKDNPDKARGKRGDLIFFEEAGIFPGLKKAWEVARPSVEQGSYTVGTLIAYGTGGTEKADYASLEELFYNPESYNVLPIDNMWDEGAKGMSCCFFMPSYMNWEGFMDKDGNSDIEGAKAHLKENREKKKEADDPDALKQYTAENPFTPREATLRVSQNIYPTTDLQAHQNSVLSQKRHSSLLHGTLYRNSEGDVTFEKTPDANPVHTYPTPKDADNTGCISIKESPWRNSEGETPPELYVVCHDPYAHDGDGESLGAAYVLKRTNNFSKTLNECIVASYVGRPSTQDEYNRNLFLLAEYYNAKIGFENDRGDVIGYAKRFNKLHYLEEQFEILEKKQRYKRKSRRSTSRPYGMGMTEPRKNQAQIYLKQWLLTPVNKYEDGEKKLVLHTILDPALLEELIKYHPDGNFDRISALFIGMYHLKELESKEVAPERGIKKHSDFFERELYPR